MAQDMQPEEQSEQNYESIQSRNSEDVEALTQQQGGCGSMQLTFVLLPSGFQYTTECQLNTTGQQALHLLERKTGHKLHGYRLYYNQQELENESKVINLLKGQQEPYVLEVRQVEGLEQPGPIPKSDESLDQTAQISTFDAPADAMAADVGMDGTLEGDSGADESNEMKALQLQVFTPRCPDPTILTILIDSSQALPKPFLGGFRNRKTAQTYHHATTQTPKVPKYSQDDLKISRDTQTKVQKARGQQTVRECATQVERPGLLLDSSEDRVVVAGSYVEAKEVEAKRLWAVRLMQRHTRGWFARNLANKLREQRNAREEFLKAQETAQKKLAEVTRQREIKRRMQPRTADDFCTLYNEVEAWRQVQTKAVKTTTSMSPEEKQQQLYRLLREEVKFLQTIDRLKIIAAKEGRLGKEARLLAAMSRPKRWELRNGGAVLVHTPLTTRAKELQLLYRALTRTPQRLEERLDALLHVKWTVKEFECSLTHEIVQLVDREADLLNRGRKASTLQGLRRRLANLFVQFILTPEFNPEASRFQVTSKQIDEYYFSDLHPMVQGTRQVQDMSAQTQA